MVGLELVGERCHHTVQHQQGRLGEGLGEMREGPLRVLVEDSKHVLAHHVALTPVRA